MNQAQKLADVERAPPQPCTEERLADPAARLRRAAAGSNRRRGDNRLRRVEHRGVGPAAGSRRLRPARLTLVHDRLVLEVGVAEDHLVDAVPVDQLRQLVLWPNRDPLRVPPTGQRPRVDPVGDAGDLRRGERDDLAVRIVAERDVEKLWKSRLPAPMITTFVIAGALP